MHVKLTLIIRQVAQNLCKEYTRFSLNVVGFYSCT